MELNGFKIEKYNQFGIQENARAWTCPLCSHTRKKSKDKCLSVFWDTGIGQCNHCDERIQLHTYKKRETVRNYKKPVWRNKTELSENVVKWLADRKISQETLIKFKITEGVEWMPQTKKREKTIQFNYFIKDELINIKYRTRNKDFKLHKDSELIFWNLDSIIGESECYVTEGEIDALSIDQCGKSNVVSVPNGASNGENQNLVYLDNCIDYFKDKEKIFLCIDNDEAGKNLEKELLRRLGTERCFHFDFGDCKDANEYHMKFGAAKLLDVLNSPIAYPILDISTMKDDGDALDDYLINGMAPGYGTGLSVFDNIFTVMTGMFKVITGIPTHGKTTVLDFIICRWNIRHGFKIAICSPENMPVIIHKERIITKILGYKPNSVDHVNSQAYKDVKAYVDENFYFMSFVDGRHDLSKVLEKAKELIVRKGIRALVIDPFNKVKFKESKGKKIVDYTNDYLNELDVFARANDIIPVLVAHPTKMQKDAIGNRAMPDFYDIKGGGEFADMTPLSLVVHRDFQADELIIKVLKVKFAHLGTNNAEIRVKYNINNGRIGEINEDGSIDYDNSNWLNSAKTSDGASKDNSAYNSENERAIESFDDYEQMPF